MAADVVPYDFDGNNIRVAMIDGEPWWVAADVCSVLGTGRQQDVTRHLDDDERGECLVDTPSGRQRMVSVNEAGLYSLILRSRKAAAKRFKRWVTHEVIPSIRKTGSYGNRSEVPGSYADALELAAQQARELEAAKPKVNAWDALASTDGDYSLRQAAQVLDRDPNIKTGQNRLMATLREVGWVDYSGQPYQREVDSGRVHRRVTSYTHPHTGEPTLTAQTRLTAKGIQALHNKLGGVGTLQLGGLELDQ